MREEVEILINLNVKNHMRSQLPRLLRYIAFLSFVIIFGSIALANINNTKVDVTVSGGLHDRVSASFTIGEIEEHELPRRQIFGMSPHSRKQGCITEMCISLHKDVKFFSPKEAFSDLLNTGIISTPFCLYWLGDDLVVKFDGGDGEKFYRAVFEFNPKTGVMKRSVTKLAQGTWKSDWKWQESQHKWRQNSHLVFKSE